MNSDLASLYPDVGYGFFSLLDATYGIPSFFCLYCSENCIGAAVLSNIGTMLCMWFNNNYSPPSSSGIFFFRKGKKEIHGFRTILLSSIIIPNPLKKVKKLKKDNSVDNAIMIRLFYIWRPGRPKEQLTTAVSLVRVYSYLVKLLLICVASVVFLIQPVKG